MLAVFEQYIADNVFLDLNYVHYIILSFSRDICSFRVCTFNLQKRRYEFYFKCEKLAIDPFKFSILSI